MSNYIKLKDGECSNGVLLTDPVEEVIHTIGFNAVEYDINIPAEVMFMSLNDIIVKLDFASEYLGKEFTIVVDTMVGSVIKIEKNEFKGVFTISDDYNNPILLG